jgi:PucR family transcriptional regulator, purine catabolism regulatory protein
MLRLRLPDAAPGEICAVAVAVPGDHPTALVVEPISDQLPSPVVLQHVAVGGALELAQLTAGQERQRRLGADLLARLLDRRIDPQVAEAQLAEYGVDPASCVLAAARGGTDGTGAELDRRLARARIPHLLLHRDHTLYVVIADTAADVGLLVTPGGQAGTLGTSDRLRAAHRLPEAAQEACWALSAAEAEGRRIVRYGDETAVLLPRTPTEARVLVSRILSPLMSHDAEHGTDYVHTLRVVLRLDRSWQRAAAELHIHKQTLGYRIRRIEQITGRGLTRTEHIAEWWIALRAHDLLTGRNPSLRPAGRDGEQAAVETTELGADLHGAGVADLAEHAQRLSPCPAGGVHVARAAVDVAQVIEGARLVEPVGKLPAQLEGAFIAGDGARR